VAVDAETLNALVLSVFGARGTRKHTSGLGHVGGYPTIILGAIQGHPFTLTTLQGFDRIVDARESLESKLKKGEWTAYHAEMMILRAVLQILKIKTDTSYEQISAELKNFGGLVICADAPCCKHCGNMLDKLKIEYHGEKGAHGLTGWWNPLTDKAVSNGVLEFQKDIPGA
jgi:hypothetical protein